MANHPTHETSTAEHGESHGPGHVVPVKLLVATGVMLLILTVITVEISRFHFGPANIFVALLIAGLKATLVVLIFMHLRWDRPFNSFIFVASLFFVLLFIAFTLTDSYEYRSDKVAGNAKDVQQRLVELSTE